MCKNAVIGKHFLVNGAMLIRLNKTSVVSIGSNVIINNRLIDNYVGLNKKSTVVVLKNASLTIGNNSGFSNISIFCKSGIHIGDYCNFGGNCFIWDTDFHQLNYLERRKSNGLNIQTRPIKIGNDVFVGANTIILKGTEIGDRSIIGAGSVVSKSVPADEIWAGNPIRFIKKIN